MQKIAIVFALLVTIIIGFNPAEPQGEELLYFLPEVQLARSQAIQGTIENEGIGVQIFESIRDYYYQVSIEELMQISVDTDAFIDALVSEGLDRQEFIDFLLDNEIDLALSIRLLKILFIPLDSEEIFNLMASMEEQFLIHANPFDPDLFSSLVGNESISKIVAIFGLLEGQGISLQILPEIVGPINEEEVLSSLRSISSRIEPKVICGSFFHKYQSEIDKQTSNLWVNNAGELRSKAEAKTFLDSSYRLNFIWLICSSTLVPLESSLGFFSEELLMDIISGESVHITDEIILDGSRESMRMVFMDNLAGNFTLGMIGITTSNLFDFITVPSDGADLDEDTLNALQMRVSQNEFCTNLKNLAKSSENIALQFSAFKALSLSPEISDFTLRFYHVRLFPCFEPEFLGPNNLESISQSELEQRARDGDIDAAVALSIFLVKKVGRAFISGRLSELKQELMELTLQSTAGAAPLVTLALIEPLSLVGLD
jgi:hypothetical protein